MAIFESIPSQIIRGKNAKNNIVEGSEFKKAKKERSVFINKKTDTK